MAENTKLEYRENSYFNDQDYFLFYDAPMKKYLVTKVHNENKDNKGSWFTTEGLQFKATSVKCVNCSELL